MKNIIAAILLGVCLGACASNQPNSSGEVAEAGSAAKTERVCETVRSNDTGTRIRRVCREVPVSGTEDE